MTWETENLTNEYEIIIQLHEYYKVYTQAGSGSVSVCKWEWLGSPEVFSGHPTDWMDDEHEFHCETWSSRRGILVSSDLYYLPMKLPEFGANSKVHFFWLDICKNLNFFKMCISSLAIFCSLFSPLSSWELKLSHEFQNSVLLSIRSSKFLGSSDRFWDSSFQPYPDKSIYHWPSTIDHRVSRYVYIYIPGTPRPNLNSTRKCEWPAFKLVFSIGPKNKKK